MRHTCLLSSIAAVFLIHITDWLPPCSVPKDQFCLACCHQAVPRWCTEVPRGSRHSISFRLRLVNSPLNREHRDADCILFLNCEEIYLDAWDFLKILESLTLHQDPSGLDLKLGRCYAPPRPAVQCWLRGRVCACVCVCVRAALVAVPPMQDSRPHAAPRQKPQASWCRTVTSALTARHTNHLCFYFSSLGRNRC